MTVDVATFVGEYPYRALPATSVRHLLGEMDRTGIDRAWVGHLPSFLYRDPAPGTEALLRDLAPHRDRLRPVPAIHPGLPRWRDDLDRAVAAGSPAVRLYPLHQGLVAEGAEMTEGVAAAAGAGVTCLLTVRFEDLRQRHPADTTPDLPAHCVRTLARTHRDARILVTHAGRPFIEEVHFGLTEEEQRRVLWDVSWVWGPPEDDLRLLLRTVGVERFTFGTGMPLRIPDATVAKLDLADLSPGDRAKIQGDNLEHWRSRR